MTDPLERFKNARQRAGHMALPVEARTEMERWLASMRAAGWSAEDEAEYLQAVADDTRTPERLQAAREFWRSKCDDLDRLDSRLLQIPKGNQSQTAAQECRDHNLNGGSHGPAHPV